MPPGRRVMVRVDQPPRVPTGAITRRRLLDRLEGRFDVPLTIVVGGGGIGKTTLLAQALTDQPDRVDVWLTAVEADDRDRLYARLLNGLGRTESAIEMDQITEAVMAMAPRQVCLVIDDAHRLPDHEPLAELIEALPRNGHLLVGSRRRPSLSLARLDAAGLLLEIDQTELLFTDDELVEIARNRRIDVDVLEGAAGWPAFVELASRGEGARGRRYLEEEAVAGLDPERLLALAAFAFVGGGDDEMALAVTGVGLEDLLHGLPLVIGDPKVDARPHDLWLELLADRLAPADRSRAAVAAAAVLRDRGDLDSAIEMVARVGAADEFESLVREACLTILDGGLRPERLARWASQIPEGREESGVAHLVRGLLEREREPGSDQCWAELEAAAAAFGTAGDSEAEIAAMAQLGYLSQILGRDDHLIVLLARMGELAADGVSAAQPFLAFGESWMHFAAGDPAAQLAAVEHIDDHRIPYAWRLIRSYLRANALMNLGRPAEALEIVPAAMRDRSMPIPGALTLEDRARWASGHPEVINERGIVGLSADYGSRDRYIGGTWGTAAYCYAGRREDSLAALEVARQAAGPDPGPIVELQLLGLSWMPDLAVGLEERPAEILRELFAIVPLETPVVKTQLLSHVALVYVLLPETRSFWDETALGPAAAVARSVGQALVAHRESGDLGPIRMLRWPEPGIAASVLPVPWLIEFALIGGVAGVPAARDTAAWACEHWGAPAREALRRHAEADGDLGEMASTWLVEVPMPPDVPVSVSLLGSMTLHHDGRPSSHPAWRRERVRALLLYLVLHGPASRDRVAYSLWPDLPAQKADKNLRTTLSYLHQVLEPMRGARDAPWFVRNELGMLSLHKSLAVDLWEFDSLLDEAAALEQQGASTRALDRYLEAIPRWRGDLAAGEADHSWADLERTRLRSRLVRAAGRAGDLLVAGGRADAAIAVCHLAIEADRWFEPAYATLARAYVDLDDLTSARATVTTAASALAEIGQDPSDELTRLLDNR